MTIRKPIAAGSFYEADSKKLRKSLKDLFKNTKQIIFDKTLKIIIVPHAGFQYSGIVAASVFKQLENTNFQNIYLIGTSHFAYFNNPAVYSSGEWETPLGKTKVNNKLTKNLINQSNYFEENLSVFNEEHSLEVELPFLQFILNNFTIVPILIGNPNNKYIQEISAILSKNITENDLIVISSDLSHYPQYNLASKIDMKTIKLICELNIPGFEKHISESLLNPRVETAACGWPGIVMSLKIANNLNLKSVKLIKYLNSGDVSCDKNRVVGYAGIVFSE